MPHQAGIASNPDDDADEQLQENTTETTVLTLNTEKLLSEPSMLLLKPIEWRLSKLVEATKQLARIREIRTTFNPTWSAEETWRTAMENCFEPHKNLTLAFVQMLPGYSAICSADRASLFKASLFPIVAAQLSLDFDAEMGQENFLSMDTSSVELMFHHFPPLEEMRQHFQDAGTAIKKSNLDPVEFGLLTTFLFFNTETSNLIDAEKVNEIGDEYRHAAVAHIAQTLTDRKAVDERLDSLQSLARYFATLQSVHTSVMAKLAQQSPPNILTLNAEHHQMYTRNFIHAS